VAFTAFAGLALLVYVFLASAIANSRRLRHPAAIAVVPPFLLAVALTAVNLAFLRRAGWPRGMIGFDRPDVRARQFAAGFVAGVALVVSWAIIIAVASGARWQVAHGFDPSGAALVLCLTFLVNLSEELAYRGYLFVRIARSFGNGTAIVGTSLVFFLFHVQSGVPWASAAAGVLTCAMIYGVLFARWRSVPLALGFHWANNVAQHAVGLRAGALTLVEPVGVGRPGTEAVILIAVAALNVAAAAALYFAARWRGANGDPVARDSPRRH